MEKSREEFLQDSFDKDINFVFHEPHITGGDCKVTISAKKAVSFQEGVHDYKSHIDALDDFIIVNWAYRERETI